MSGCLSAILVGAALGTAGRWLGSDRTGPIAFCLAGFVATIVAAREWGWISFPLPERKCQTEKVWAHEFGFVIASAMWGFHIGLGFATRVTYGGFWVLVAIALALGDSLFAAVLMLLYWLGRALPLWVAPVLLKSVQDVMESPQAILVDRPRYQLLAGLASAWTAGVAVLLALRAQLP
ncbi:MAG: hypothetical protein L0387_40035 [Acidobacteria bacterium]|nr:hypothetical protein [Acidobacteriota bacterium]